MILHEARVRRLPGRPPGIPEALRGAFAGLGLPAAIECRASLGVPVSLDRLSGCFDLIHQDPAMNRVKLIAEPWDVGEGGYQVGNFPPLWSEWNGKYRDTLRDFVRGTDQTLAEFASRFTGSSDLYATTG